MKVNKIDTDALAIMPDDELYRRYEALTAFLRREERRGRRNEDLEVEHCYFARETEVRQNRIIAHQNYLEKMGVQPDYE